MKKIITLLFVLGFTFVLSACTRPTGCTDDEVLVEGACRPKQKEIQVLTDVSYASTIEYTQFVGDEYEIGETKWFEARFLDVDIIPVSNRVCTDFNIVDGNYQGYTYFVMMVTTSNQATIGSETFVLDTVNTDVHTCFGGVDSSEEYMVLIGKLKASGDGILEAVAGFTFTVTDFNDRYHISEIELDYTLSELAHEGKQKISYDLSYLDASKNIDEITVLVKENAAQSIIASKTFSSEDGEMNQSIIEYLNNDFDVLSPGTGYTISVYISGNDNINNFDDVLVYSSAFLTDKKEYMALAFHELYAYLDSFHLEEDGLHINIFVKNTGYIRNQITDTPFHIEFNMYNEAGALREQTQLIKGLNQLVIPYENVFANDTIKVELADTTNVLLSILLSEEMPEITDIELVDSTIEYNASESFLDPESITINLLTKNSRTIIESQENVVLDFENPNEYIITSDLTGYSAVIVQFVFTYKGFDDNTETIFEYEIELSDFQ